MKMTREQFVAKAVLAAERALGVPAGWWGAYRDVTNGVVRVSFTSGAWAVRIVRDGAWTLISRHDSRGGAIGKARKLAGGWEAQARQKLTARAREIRATTAS